MKYDKINIMVPTYKRVDRLRKLVKSALNTANAEENVCFTFCVNEKDDESWNAVRELQEECESCIVVESTRQPNLSKYFNLMYEQTKFKDAGTLVSMIGDDMVFETAGWDNTILDTMNEAEGKLVVYCNDGFIAQDKLCVNLFTSRLVVDSTKRPFMCERYHAEMIDLVWFLVASQASILKYLPDVVIKHEHDSGKNADERDATWKRLQPLRILYGSRNSRSQEIAYATRYAVQTAMNLIEKGVGQWCTLNV